MNDKDKQLAIAINYIKWLLPYAHEYLKDSNKFVNCENVLNQIRKFVEENEIKQKKEVK